MITVPNQTYMEYRASNPLAFGSIFQLPLRDTGLTADILRILQTSGITVAFDDTVALSNTFPVPQ